MAGAGRNFKWKRFLRPVITLELDEHRGVAVAATCAFAAAGPVTHVVAPSQNRPGSLSILFRKKMPAQTCASLPLGARRCPLMQCPDAAAVSPPALALQLNATLLLNERRPMQSCRRRGK